jgi:hypothetical protein
MLPFVLQILKLLPFSYSLGDKLLNTTNNSLFWNSLPNKIITKVNLQKEITLLWPSFKAHCNQKQKSHITFSYQDVINDKSKPFNY